MCSTISLSVCHICVFNNANQPLKPERLGGQTMSLLAPPPLKKSMSNAGPTTLNRSDHNDGVFLSAVPIQYILGISLLSKIITPQAIQFADCQVLNIQQNAL